jgi:hypothetical protein
MNDSEYWRAVADVDAFRDSARIAAINSTLRTFSAIVPTDSHAAIRWDDALLAASLVTPEAPEYVQDGALRITQGCLQSDDANSTQRDAASYLLSRLGNSRAVTLAAQKGLVPPSETEGAFSPLGLDLVRRRISLNVDIGNSFLPVNDFQRDFWTAAKSRHWVSLSAPTSVGKSFIVKQWLAYLAHTKDRLRAVYLVPTRALIDEVSRDLEKDLSGHAAIITLPWDLRVDQSSHEVYVLTQERLHVLLQRRPRILLDFLFIDEAHKLGDDSRGVLLQRVIDEVAASANPQIIYASPLTSNPELLTEGSPDSASSIRSESVTVNQTLLHVTQKRNRPKSWNIALVQEGMAITIGEFALKDSPSPRSKRLPLVAVALGASHSGNVIYANGPADAEKFAGQVFDALGDAFDVSGNDGIADLIELVEKTIHPQYLLARYLSRGVAFHYGNMPLLVREEVERLFRQGHVKYLVCTSTLLEGVNLPCQNLFVRAPKKGQTEPLSMPDFWNLAGRAGRWGVEFQGNIICVDVDSDAWEEVPLKRVRQPIRRATDSLKSQYDAISNYVESGTPKSISQSEPLLESLFGILVTTRQRGHELAGLTWLRLGRRKTARLSALVDQAMSDVDLPDALIRRHADISPLSIQRLHAYFTDSHAADVDLELPPAESENAVTAYRAILDTINTHLGGDFTENHGRQFSLSILFVDWMRGLPLSHLIKNRLSYYERRGIKYTLPTEIRNVLTDVEKYARFQGPRYLACYVDTLAAARPSQDADAARPDIAMMMELGVSRTTELSVMSLGISRTSAVALAEHIVGDSLSPEECRAWIKEQDLEALGLPALIIADINKAVASDPYA